MIIDVQPYLDRNRSAAMTSFRSFSYASSSGPQKILSKIFSLVFLC